MRISLEPLLFKSCSGVALIDDTQVLREQSEKGLEARSRDNIDIFNSPIVFDACLEFLDEHVQTV